MNRSVLFSILGVAFLCVAILVAQKLYLNHLSQSFEIGTTQGNILNHKRVIRSQSPAKASKTSVVTGINLKSKEQLQIARRELQVFCQDAMPQIRNGTQFLAHLKSLLTILEDLDSTQLFQLEKELPSILPDKTKHTAKKLLQMVFFAIIGEEDPLLLLNSGQSLDPNDTHMLFNSLVKKDPSAAREWMESQPQPKYNLGSNGRPTLKNRYVTFLLEKDFEAGMEAWENYAVTLKDGGSFSDDTLQKLRESYADEDYSAQKTAITNLLLSAAFTKGISAAKAETEALNLSLNELNPILQNTRPYLQQDFKDSREYLDWMVEIASSEKAQSENSPKELGAFLNMISTSSLGWTKRDYEASASWLSELPPSLAKDAAIKGFSRSISDLDPEAATLWAAQIQNEKRRKEALSHSLKSWRKSNPEQARLWEERHSFLTNE